jgi:hypothetical protein
MKTEREESLIVAPDDVEDESPVRDELAKIAKILIELLVAAAVLGNREVILREGAEFLVGVEGAGRTVPKEL